MINEGTAWPKVPRWGVLGIFEDKAGGWGRGVGGDRLERTWVQGP